MDGEIAVARISKCDLNSVVLAVLSSWKAQRILVANVARDLLADTNDRRRGRREIGLAAGSLSKLDQYFRFSVAVRDIEDADRNETNSRGSRRSECIIDGPLA